MTRPLLGATLAAFLVFSAGGAAMMQTQSAPAHAERAPAKQCLIKGNISSKGERIYHVPGGRWYEATKISPLKGERWFCSETEAQKAGWRRSKQ